MKPECEYPKCRNLADWDIFPGTPNGSMPDSFIPVASSCPDHVGAILAEDQQARPEAGRVYTVRRL